MNPPTAFVGAPLLTLLYGVIRLLSEPGPGLAWITGHGALLVSLGLYGVVLIQLDRHTFTGFTVVGCTGLVASAAQFVIDLVVGFMAADHTEMSDLLGRVYDTPGLEVAVQRVGPSLFHLALFAVMTHLAIQLRIPLGVPVAVLVASVLPAFELDLLPVSAVLVLIAFATVVRGTVDLEEARP